MFPDENLGPAKRLTGKTLSDGWIVGERIAQRRGARSVGYEVTAPDGKKAFLKAVDFSLAWDTDDYVSAVRQIAEAFEHERDLVDRCREKGMSRVVRGLGHGQIQLPDSELGVLYMIFELAEGDVRDELAKVDRTEQVWRLKTLHQAAVGLNQMHFESMFHQNVKPAHLLSFGRRGVKLGDLSTGTDRGSLAPLADDELPGDPAYAPPECLYKFSLPDDAERRQARDMYLFGSLIAFLYLEVTTTTAMLKHLDAEWYPRNTAATFEQALPYLEEAFAQVADDLRNEPGVPEELVASFRELCEPDPRRRGHPQSRAMRHGSPYSLERYVSRLDILAKRLERRPEDRAA